MDISKPTDKANPLKAVEHLTKDKAKANLDKLTRQMERRGVDHDKASVIAGDIVAQAEGPIATDDWMTLDATRFSDDSQQKLDAAGLTRDAVLDDPDKVEDYAACVFEMEGIPDGDGGVDKPKNGIASGHYEKRGDGGVGIDLVAAEKGEEDEAKKKDTKKIDGCPIVIEVKKYKQTSSAHLENSSVGGKENQTLEREVAKWKAEREQQARAGIDANPDAAATWKPEVAAWRQQVAQDQQKMKASGELPIQQMDDLWTQDRWLKLIKTDEGRQRMRDIGVDEKYLDYENLRSSPDLPEWQNILDRRKTVVVSDSRGSVGKRLFWQALRDGRSKAVMKIEV